MAVTIPKTFPPAASAAAARTRPRTDTRGRMDEAAHRHFATSEALIDCVILLCERLKTAGRDL